MVNFTILAGGSGLFIASYLFNSHASTLSLLNEYPTGVNPSWLALSPCNNSILYAINEGTLEDGAVQSFVVSPSGVVSDAISTVSSGGGIPAYVLALSTGEVAVTNYIGGNARVIPTSPGNPLSFEDSDASAAVIPFPHPAGGDSHPHMTLEYGVELFIPDLGADTIWRLIKNDFQWLIAGSIEQPVGSGPRHIAIADDLLYTLHETSSTLTIQAIPALGTTSHSDLIASASIVPADAPMGSAYGAAELLIPPPNPRFPIQYIYASNRNIGQVMDDRGDSIAIFQYTAS